MLLTREHNESIVQLQLEIKYLTKRLSAAMDTARLDMILRLTQKHMLKVCRQRCLKAAVITRLGDWRDDWHENALMKSNPW